MLHPGRFHLNGYTTGVYSSRRIEVATYESVAFRYIAANTQPDHDSQCTFRKRFLNETRWPRAIEAQLETEVKQLLARAEAADHARENTEAAIKPAPHTDQSPKNRHQSAIFHATLV